MSVKAKIFLFRKECNLDKTIVYLKNTVPLNKMFVIAKNKVEIPKVMFIICDVMDGLARNDST